MNDLVKPDRGVRPVGASAAFLLSQIGAHASTVFAEQVRPLGITPAGAGVLRVLSRAPGLSQRELAERLGAVPSRVVVLVDALESAGLVERTRDATDRRTQRLDLTSTGRELLSQIRDAAELQQASVLAPLDDTERAQLEALLGKLATGLDLDREVHLGYRTQSQTT